MARDHVFVCSELGPHSPQVVFVFYQGVWFIDSGTAGSKKFEEVLYKLAEAAFPDAAKQFARGKAVDVGNHVANFVRMAARTWTPKSKDEVTEMRLNAASLIGCKDGRRVKFSTDGLRIVSVEDAHADSNVMLFSDQLYDLPDEFDPATYDFNQLLTLHELALGANNALGFLQERALVLAGEASIRTFLFMSGVRKICKSFIAGCLADELFGKQMVYHTGDHIHRPAVNAFIGDDKKEWIVSMKMVGNAKILILDEVTVGKPVLFSKLKEVTAGGRSERLCGRSNLEVSSGPGMHIDITSNEVEPHQIVVSQNGKSRQPVDDSDAATVILMFLCEPRVDGSRPEKYDAYKAAKAEKDALGAGNGALSAHWARVQSLSKELCKKMKNVDGKLDLLAQYLALLHWALRQPPAISTMYTLAQHRNDVLKAASLAVQQASGGASAAQPQVQGGASAAQPYAPGGASAAQPQAPGGASAAQPHAQGGPSAAQPQASTDAQLFGLWVRTHYMSTLETGKQSADWDKYGEAAVMKVPDLLRTYRDEMHMPAPMAAVDILVANGFKSSENGAVIPKRIKQTARTINNHVVYLIRNTNILTKL